jgi:amino acid transporter
MNIHRRASVKADGNAMPIPELGKSRRQLGRFDTICFMVAAVVVLDTLGAVALGGVETFTWLVAVSVAFLVPAGFVLAELGSAYPTDGGPYVWARRAFGRTAGTFVALAYWAEAAVWVGGSLAITAIAVVNELVLPVSGPVRVALALGFVWTAIGIAAAPLSAGKLITAVGAFTQITLLAFYTLTVGLFAAKEGIVGWTLDAATPSWAGFVLVAPVLVYSFLGLELPSAAGGEMRNPQLDVPASIAKAGAIITFLYCVPVLAILLVVPAGERSGLTGFIDALSSVFSVYGGYAAPMKAAAAVAFVGVLLANGLTWLIGSSRAAAAACQDGAGP